MGSAKGRAPVASMQFTRQGFQGEPKTPGGFLPECSPESTPFINRASSNSDDSPPNPGNTPIISINKTGVELNMGSTL